MATATRKPLLYNPFDPALRVDPYPIYHRLRELDPVHRSPLGFWAFSRYDDVSRVQRDTSLGFFSQENVNRLAAAVRDASSPAAKIGRWLLFTDRIEHQRFRGLMNPFFSPRALERVRAVIEAEVEELLAGLPARGTTDLMSTFAQLLPINMLCTWLGIPRNDRERCRSWAASIGRVLVSVLNPELIRSMADAILACDAYVREQVAQRHRAPQDDLLTALLEAEFDGRPIDDDELVANVILLLGATYETTVNMIGNSILALLRHPEQLELLRSDRSLLTGAVEELLRYDSPAQLHGRFNYDELEVGGRLIPPESRLILLIGAANRDPDRFEDPDVLDVTRYDAKPLSFGGGPHYCLGAGVARLESQICLSLLLDRFPRLRLVEEKIRWRSEPVALRALRALPVELDAA